MQVRMRMRVQVMEAGKQVDSGNYQTGYRTRSWHVCDRRGRLEGVSSGELLLLAAAGEGVRRLHRGRPWCCRLLLRRWEGRPRRPTHLHAAR